jgi:predicted aspartyl protease
MPRIWASFPKNSLPVITVRIGTASFRALVDCGASLSFITPSLAIRLGLPLTGQYSFYTIRGDLETVQTLNVPNLWIGQFQLGSFSAGVYDLSRMKLPIQALLGVNAFAGRCIQLDFENGRLYILR